MDITWYGQNCFKITERGRLTIITDPFSEHIGLAIPKLKADVVTLSQNHPDYNNLEAVKGYEHVLTGAGEYEIGGVFIYGIPLHYVGESVVQNVGYVFKYDDISVVHLGNLSHVPDQSTLESIGEVHVALVPVGGGNALKASAATEVISLLEPSYIVPMHYGLSGLNDHLEPVEKFLKEMGLSKAQEEDMLRVTGTLPEQPQVIVLRPQA
ncbi:MAG: MBL fold metallo-hydrolase [Anaerolineae bacterium]|nr:MBL fold metallo-hydrolase [Anaerolineae bacterium]